MGLVIQTTSTYSFSLLLPVMALYGGLNFAIYPVSVARAHDLFEPSEIVSVSSALIFCYGFGACIGPVAASSVMAAFDRPHSLFTFVIGVAAVFAVLVFILRSREKVSIVTAADQASFIPMQNTSPVAMVMDPRSDFDTGAADETPIPEA
jgi:MFS family permease